MSTRIREKIRLSGCSRVYKVAEMGSVAQWIAHWTSSEQWKKPFKGCGFESHQTRVLLRMLRYSVVPRPSAVPYPRPKKGFYSCTSYSEQNLPQMRPIAVGRRLLL